MSPTATAPLAAARKGGVYAFTLRDGTVKVGTARSSASGPGARVGVSLPDGSGYYMIPLARLREATADERKAVADAAAGTKQAVAAKVGDLRPGMAVEFDDKGRVHRGVLVGVRGLRATVEGELGRWTLSVAILRKVDVAPGDAGRLAGYAVAKYKESALASRETTCFEAIITKDGRPVVAAYNDGHGGATTCYRLQGSTANSTAEDVAAFEAALKSELAELGDYGGVETFIQWYRRDRVLGVSFPAFVARFRALAGG